MKKIFKDHPLEKHPLAISISSIDEVTTTNCNHRVLTGNGSDEVFIEFMDPLLEKHHISKENLERYKSQLKKLRIKGLPKPPGPYPKKDTTRKGNYGEVFLAEYLSLITDTEILVYRLRFNPNPDESMKGDDVLMFNMNTSPVQIIVGEAKYRKTPNKTAVEEMNRGLISSSKKMVPVSLNFVADRLIEDGQIALGEKIHDLYISIIEGILIPDYVGLLMSNKNAQKCVNNYSTSKLQNLHMISIGFDNPDYIVDETYKRMEGRL